MNTFSPLRYPGGKASLASYLKHLIKKNDVTNGTYFELYAGGAGAALDLLFSKVVHRIILNDADIHIFSFWNEVLHDTEAFIHEIEAVSIDIDSWYHQRDIYNDPIEKHSQLELGFSTFFLNRCNRSGIIKKAGPIGGMNQEGNYLINCRFNKRDLIQRIERIARERENIEIYNEDTLCFIENNIARLQEPHSFMYLDPPYYQKGKALYLNSYDHEDHVRLRDLLGKNRSLKWMVSYDNVPEIKLLYERFHNTEHELSYSLQNKRKTNELFIFSDSIQFE